ncbi:hypothetical protein CGMCC3_g14597 [Colletotrichum fructicola]|nr:uncharacterized protein CGMCC3_g14597 [Colletotrichum fructicola]KAE9569280.1 hypothetical protein CGMCC3_g14597 [Colletotrichum fructicola]
MGTGNCNETCKVPHLTVRHGAEAVGRLHHTGASGCAYENDAPNQSQVPPSVSSSDKTQHAPDQVAQPQSQYLTPSSSGISRQTSTGFPSMSGSLTANSWTQPSKPASASGQSCHGTEALRLQLRMQQLESQLSNQSQSIPRRSPVTLSSPAVSSSPAPATVRASAMDADVEIISSQLGGTFHIHSTRDTILGQDQPLIANGLSFKTRLLGQSHWAVSTAHLIRDIFSTLGQYEGTPDTNWTGIGRCKSLARYIKARRTPAWPPPPNSKLPSKEVADTLLDNYLRTTESIYRILHLPTFRRQYEALWVNDTVPDPGFLVQLKLVLAIGAVTYDDEFSLRTSAILWVYEAQVWLAEPNFKARLNIQFLQTNLLLLFAQERVGVAGDSTWVLSGTILRKAMHMGLHRDPNHLPGRSAYEAEMRRRLWNTVLEVDLQASLSSGGAPLISMSDFDTAPPGNFDEEQLEADGPTPRPPSAFTQVSVAIALRQTFPQRLAVVNFLNGLRVSPGTYEDTLRIDTELREAFKGLSRILRTAFSSSSSQAQNAKSEVQLVDFHMQRYLISLHAPYFGPAHGTAYTYSQKAVVESSLRIWRAACPPPALASNGLQLNPGVGETESDLPRLASCSSGFYQTATFHAALLIALDLRSQLQEEEEYSLLGPTPLRPDLMSVMEEARMWCLRVIEAGETNVKGYLLMNLVAAQIRSMMGLMKKDEVAGELIKAVKGVEEKCLPILERMAEEVGMDAAGAETIDDILGQLPEPMELWQGMEDWVFNDDMKSGDFVF